MNQRFTCRKITVALDLLLLPINVIAQADHPLKVSVGDRVVDGSVIKPYKNLWQFTYTKQTGESLTAERGTTKWKRSMWVAARC